MSLLQRLLYIHFILFIFLAQFSIFCLWLGKRNLKEIRGNIEETVLISKYCSVLASFTFVLRGEVWEGLLINPK